MGSLIDGSSYGSGYGDGDGSGSGSGSGMCTDGDRTDANSLEPLKSCSTELHVLDPEALTRKECRSVESVEDLLTSDTKTI